MSGETLRGDVIRVIKQNEGGEREIGEDGETDGADFDTHDIIETTNGRKVEILFRFASHATKYDVNGLKERIEGADVYFPECIDWTQEYALELQDIADGKIEPDGGFFGHRAAEAQAIYNSGVKIMFADIPRSKDGMDEEDRELFEQYKKLEDGVMENEQFVDRPIFLSNEASRIFPFDLNEAINLLRQSLTIFAKSEIIREEFIIRQLKKKLKKLIEEQSDLDKISVVVSMGIAHSLMHRDLSRQVPEFKVKKEFFPITSLVNFGYLTEATKRIKAGLEVDDELLARALLGQYIVRAFNLCLYSQDSFQ